MRTAREGSRSQPPPQLDGALRMLSLALGSRKFAFPRLLLRLFGIHVGPRSWLRLRGMNPPWTDSVRIDRPPEEVYLSWRQLSQLPRFISYLESVHETGRISHWVARLPTGRVIEWDTELIEDLPGEVIAWRSLEGSPVETSGRVTFSRAGFGRATKVRLQMQLALTDPGPIIALTRLFVEPKIKSDLRRFKHAIEAGAPAL